MLPNDIIDVIVSYCDLETVYNCKEQLGIVTDQTLRLSIKNELMPFWDLYVKEVSRPVEELNDSELISMPYLWECDDGECNMLKNRKLWVYPIELIFPEHLLDFLVDKPYLFKFLGNCENNYMIAFDNNYDWNREYMDKVLPEAQYYFPFMGFGKYGWIMFGVHCNKKQFAFWNYFDDEGNEIEYGDNIPDLITDYLRSDWCCLDDDGYTEDYLDLIDIREKLLCNI